ncbi:MAG TPA: glycosyltransferase [Solirubrobacteraceae bacterium]|jgi:glycosyltransferase involved in cell wall biosynthesis|nr:glycosyltransferase [Solirubrobacteraceae bacterium]
MILFLHNRYRIPGGEERVVDDLLWLVREHLGEPAELLARDSHDTVRARAAAGLLRGGLRPDDVGEAVRRTGARVVHAHNLHPSFGWRALAAARAAGARVVLHLHQYRLVCAVGVCFTGGKECVRCHGRNTLPGVLRNCRGARAEALVYGSALSLWQRRMVEHADAVVAPSDFARARLRELGASLPWERVHVLAPPVRALEDGVPARRGAPMPTPAGEAMLDDQEADRCSSLDATASTPSEGYALMVGRLSPEKGVEVAIEACRIAGVPLVVAGAGLDGDEQGIGDAGVRFLGRVDEARLAQLRADAALALMPSRSAETFGLAAAEAMAAGLPVVGSRIGALPELLEEQALAPPGDAPALAAAIARALADPAAGERARERVRTICAPERVAAALAEIYAAAEATRPA